MAKKVTAILVSLFVVAGAVVGVYFYQQSEVSPASQATEATAATEVYLDESLEDEDYVVEESDETEAAAFDDDDNDFVPSDDSLANNTDDITTTKFTIERVYDLSTKQDVQPRVVFGSGFRASDNYIKFDSQGNFEMYVSGYLSETTVGSYEEFSDFIYVEFEDGTAAEYDIEYDDSGVISYIIVDYGDYEIYFS